MSEMSARTQGNDINYTPGSALVAGQVVPLESMIGVAPSPIEAILLVALHIRGVADGVACLGTDVVGIGDQLYWDDTNNRLTLTATDNTYAGAAASASPNGTETVDLIINAPTKTKITS